MDPFIENRITVVGPQADLEAIASDLTNDYACDAVVHLGTRVTCCDYTLGKPAHDFLVELSGRYPKVTVGNLWWTEDADAHGCSIWVVGTTEFEWWGEGMELADEDDFDCWEDAVAAEAELQHGQLMETFLASAELKAPEWAE
jgi:hypothetical protein